MIAVRDEFMDVSDEEVSDKNGCLSRSMTIKAINTIMTKRIWISRVGSEIVFQPVHYDTGAPLHEERVITVRKKTNLHLELYQRNVTGGRRTPDRVLWLPARDTTCAFHARDLRSHQRGIAHEDAEGCHTDQSCAPRRGARGERHLRF